MTHWHIVQVTSGREGRAERYLERLGYSRGWHPTERYRLPEAIYQRLLAAWRSRPKFAQTKRTKPDRYKTRTVVTGYVFIPADDVDVPTIDHNLFGEFMRVVRIGEKPVRIAEATMAQMRAVPDVLKEKMAEVERQREAEWQARRPVVGCEAKVMRGPFEGQLGTVVHVKAGHVEMDIGQLVGRIKLPEVEVERVAWEKLLS